MLVNGMHWREEVDRSVNGLGVWERGIKADDEPSRGL